MVAVTDALPRSGTRMSLDEWDALPETSIRLELIEGVLVVSPFPAEVHQRMVVGLMKALLPACPAELSVYNVPLPVRVPSRVSGLGPDLLVIRTADRELRDPMPALVVEVASPRARGRDQVEKRRLYEARGVPSYWLLDPQGPDLRVLELGSEGRYVEVGYAAGEEGVDLDRPFPVRLVPRALIS